MTITLEIPDELVRALVPEGQDPARAVLEAIALEGYRSQRLGESQVRRLLGFETRMQVHGFLKDHNLYLHYTLEDLENDVKVARETAQQVAAERKTDPAERLAG